MNRERVKRLVKQGKMTQAGLDSISHAFDAEKHTKKEEKVEIAHDLLKALKKDKETWKNFQAFPDSYKRIRMGWIEGARNRPEVFETRLRYFLKMTEKNKMYGMMK